MTIMIDPPSGWKYGFPKPLPDEVENVKEWLLESLWYNVKKLSYLGHLLFYRIVNGFTVLL